VREARVAARRNEDVVVDYRVEVDLEVLETLKGQAPRPLQLAFTSFPRSPRFQAQEEVILFLARGEAGLWLAHGKRSVYHVQQGEVLETGRPVSEFVKQLRGA
jgi:hypothetical protein